MCNVTEYFLVAVHQIYDLNIAYSLITKVKQQMKKPVDK